MTAAAAILLGGLAILVLGAETLVRGSARLALRLGLSPLFIGLTLVAFGTSTPELVVSLEAALRGFPSLAVGNVVGSNIFNIAIVLGVAAIISPIPVHGNLVQREVPIVIALTAILFALAHFGAVTRAEAALLLVGFVIYSIWSYRWAREEAISAQAITLSSTLSVSVSGAGRLLEPSARAVLIDLVFVAVGLAALAAGSRWVVDGAEEIARIADVSDTVIGLTVVAVGTSLPELATSVVAAIRKQTEIAVGNVLGSNIFNILVILGLTGLVHPVPVVDRLVRIDIPVAMGFAVACFPILLSSRRISRLEGVCLVLAYIGYAVLLMGRYS